MQRQQPQQFGGPAGSAIGGTWQVYPKKGGFRGLARGESRKVYPLDPSRARLSLKIIGKRCYLTGSVGGETNFKPSDKRLPGAPGPARAERVSKRANRRVAAGAGRRVKT